MSSLLVWEGAVAFEWKRTELHFYDTDDFRYKTEGELDDTPHFAFIAKRIDRYDAYDASASIEFGKHMPTELDELRGAIVNSPIDSWSLAPALENVSANWASSQYAELIQRYPHTLALLRPAEPSIEEKRSIADRSSAKPELPLITISDLKDLQDRSLPAGAKSAETFNNLGLLKYFFPFLHTSQACREYGEDFNRKHVEAISRHSYGLACFSRMGERGISLLRPFVSKFQKVAPVKLAEKLRDLVPYQDERPVERIIRTFADNRDIFEQREDPAIAHFYKSMPGKASFFSAFSQFKAKDLVLEQAGTLGYQYKVVFDNNKSTDLKDMGTGFRAILALYAYVIGGLRNSNGTIATGPLASGDDSKDNSLPDTGLRIERVDSLYIEEIETALHPAAQTATFELMINSAPLDEDIVYEDNIEGWFSLEEQTEEEKEADEKRRKKAIADAPRLRKLDQLIPRRPLIFETHSEYIIRAALNMVAKGERDNTHFAINYIHAPALQPEGEPAAYHIPIRKNGTLAREFGPGFFDEAQRLKLEMIQHNRITKEQSN